MGTWGDKPYKWSYFTLLKTGFWARCALGIPDFWRISRLDNFFHFSGLEASVASLRGLQ